MPTREEVDKIHAALDRAAELLTELIASRKADDEVGEQIAIDALAKSLIDVKVALRAVRPDK